MRQDIGGKDAASIMQKALDTAAGDSNMAPYLKKKKKKKKSNAFND